MKTKFYHYLDKNVFSYIQSKGKSVSDEEICDSFGVPVTFVLGSIRRLETKGKIHLVKTKILRSYEVVEK